MLKNLFSISVFGLAISMPAAFASTLNSTTPTTSNVDVSAGFTGTKVADTGSLAFTSSQYTSGTVDQMVYREAGGTLDFYYLISNSSASLDAIGRVTMTNFAGFSTNVSYMLSGGTAPSEADRSAAGDTVGFDFQSQATGNTLLKGTSSDVLEISTNATSFALTGTTSAIDGGTGTVITYAPTAVPEPMSMSLMGAGLAGFGLLGLRRRSAKK